MHEPPPPGEMAEKAEEAAAFLKALTNPHRLMILCLLDGCERSVSELEELLSLRQPTLSQQLAKLRADGFVSTRRDGKFVYYRLASPEAREVIAVLYRLFCTPDGTVIGQRSRRRIVTAY
ncbi:MAG: metalloregulator ArsR/SmtB family transcription factor [Pseudomonadota bacterium]